MIGAWNFPESLSIGKTFPDQWADQLRIFNQIPIELSGQLTVIFAFGIKEIRISNY